MTFLYSSAVQSATLLATLFPGIVLSVRELQHKMVLGILYVFLGLAVSCFLISIPLLLYNNFFGIVFFIVGIAWTIIFLIPLFVVLFYESMVNLSK